MDAVVISIGDELVLGQTVDTNAAWLSAALAETGVQVRYHLTVGDDRETIAAAFVEAARKAPLLLATGGLGPTEDDLTRDALALVLHQPLLLDADALQLIRDHFARRSLPMPPRNERQAMRPASTSIVPNPVGTAPGLQAALDGSSIFVMPGVPSEMEAIFRQHIQPQLRHLLADRHAPGRAILTSTVHTFGAGEFDVATRLGPELTARGRNPLVGTTVSDGIVSVRVRAVSPDAGTARRQLRETVEGVRQKLGPLVFGLEETTLEHAVVQMLIDRNQTVSTAESCTAGLAAKMLTDPPGASACFLAGYIVYSNEAKQRDLNIPAALIEKHGAVSGPVARALAENARQRAGTDYALAITGIAGPTGGSADKPVGTVHIALAQRDRPSTSEHDVFPGNRTTIRTRTARTALNMLRLRMIET